MFIGFGGVVKRKAVVENADRFVDTFEELIRLLESVFL